MTRNPKPEPRARGKNTHPAELPCIDPECRQGQGWILCLRCGCRVQNARTEHRLRQLDRRSPLPKSPMQQSIGEI